ncbi:hypothetical protein [Mesorhizobium sp. B2-7-2]|uniref:hypothetical protein n=1 Tax=Mesorhizobium sp. B2-7-2 TaxID=2589908 RepID=UPI001125F002|nr:hypothetical protein [Mesorhizobium sp. B2-7-2]TPJ30164.1 hypothetical protein FJ425_05405 [Mesorhizobium sp. B2-7-2]
MDHSRKGDVTIGYIIPDDDDIRVAAQSVADKMDELFGLVKAPEPIKESQKRFYHPANGYLARERAITTPQPAANFQTITLRSPKR